MPTRTSQRGLWNGSPDLLGPAFTLTKPKGAGTLSATCEVWSHAFGWELRLIIDGHGLQMSSVVRTPEESNATAEGWRAAMLEKGWT